MYAVKDYSNGWYAVSYKQKTAYIYDGYAKQFTLQKSENEKVEKTLVELVPPEEQSDFCHRLVMFGREVCDAKKPKCDQCPFQHFDWREYMHKRCVR